MQVGGAPIVFGLCQNYPNAFNPSTNIRFTVPTDGRATLKVFNPLGQEVATLFDANATAGVYHHVVVQRLESCKRDLLLTVRVWREDADQENAAVEVTFSSSQQTPSTRQGDV